MVSTPRPIEECFAVLLPLAGSGSFDSTSEHERLELAGVDVSDGDIGTKMFLELPHGLL